MSDLERINAPEQVRERIPSVLEMLRYRLPELAELSDEILHFNAGELWEAAKCRRKCHGCNDYTACWRDGDARGQVTKIRVENGQVIVEHPICKPRLAHEERERQARLLNASGMTEADRSFTFDNFPEEQAATHPEIYKAARMFADQYPDTNERPLYLYGPTGIGKTHLMLSVANRLNERGVTAIVIRADKLLDQLRKAIAEGAGKDELLKQYVAAPVLCIDEFGQGKMNDFTLESWLKILSGRMQASRPTWFTSNRVPTKIYERYYGQNDDQDEDIDALRSRVYALGRAARMDGDDWRMNNLDDALGPRGV